MVIVLGYNNSETEFLNDIFEENNIEYKYSLLEPKLTSAKKIILPNPDNFYFTFRKMHLMNLFSLLRLIKKPIIGINDGFHLMCNQLLDSHKCGLGLFQIDLSIIKRENNFNDFVTGKINASVDSKIVTKNLNERPIIFNSKTQLPLSKYSKASISYNNSNYSFSSEYKNYYGIDIDLEKNVSIGKEIILNFLRL